MARERFIQKNFHIGSRLLIRQANEILEEYRSMGFTLTLRQLYYQFVARDIIPNKQTEYKRLGSVINDARLAGIIDWSMIEDRTRNLRPIASWGSPRDILQVVSEQYKEDLWATQEYRPEVWIEKDALVGVIEPVCRRWRLPHFACRGYSSQSEQYAAGKRLQHMIEGGVTPIILHLGDHDPSGIDMTRDNQDRLTQFAWDKVEVRRLALNFDQIQQYRPPPNPAKETDSRSRGYKKLFGDSSWELDALSPQVIDKLISDEIDKIVCHQKWQEAELQERNNRQQLEKVSSEWDAVDDFLADRDWKEDDE